MKTLLEPEDIEAIASAVMEMLRPIVADKDNHVAEDAVFNKKTLAAYLRVSESTISKMVMNRQIPYFKVQAGQSGAVRFRQRDIDKWIQRQTTPGINPFTRKMKP
jgi:excisionase family DNA binding protein